MTADLLTSPLKKIKILAEQKQNVLPLQIDASLQPLKEKALLADPATQLSEAELLVEVAAKQPKEESESNQEPLLQESAGQYVIFPINHQDMWLMYKELVGNFWSVTETIQQIDSIVLNPDQRQYVKFFASIFASPDSRGLVNDNLAEELCKIVQITEAKFFLGHQLFVQNIHYEMYNKLLDYFAASEEKAKLFKIVENFDAVNSKRKWLAQWNNAPFAEQLMAAACLHGLMFSSLRLTCNWLKTCVKNSCHELNDILERMIYDQELQRDFACLLLSHLKNKPSNERILETVNQAVKIEFDFLLNGVKVDLIGVETNEVLQHIDKCTKELKAKLFGIYEDKKKAVNETDQKTSEDFSNSSKENHQKLCFDEDF